MNVERWTLNVGCCAPGFSVIELLVVVTVIVVIMALLAPAMDRAVYVGELATCGTRLDAIGTGAHMYAMDQRRYYPHRQAMDSQITYGPNGAQVLAEVPGVTAPRKRWGWPNVVVDEGYGASMQGDSKFYDDRPTLAPYFSGPSLPILHDPLTGGKVDFGTKTPTSVFTDYLLWFGVRFTNPAGNGKGMIRVGDRLEWTHGGQRLSTAILASDQDVFLPTGGVQKCWSSHPDPDGKLYYLQSIAPPDWVLARWERTIDDRRGPTDNNYAYADGSVQRLSELRYDDQRVSRVPMRVDDLSTAIWAHLPDTQ